MQREQAPMSWRGKEERSLEEISKILSGNSKPYIPFKMTKAKSLT
jgi:hypothetical protein